MMRLLNNAVLAAVIAFTSLAATAQVEPPHPQLQTRPQTETQPAPQTPQPAAGAPTAGPSYTGLVQPISDSLHETITGLRMDKWKGGNVREEARRDADSILTNLDSTLPGLLKDADATPQSVSSAIPLSRNLNALYAVVLRVLDAARIAASSDQASAVQDAVNQLAAANKGVYGKMEQTAAAQESRISNLQAQLKAQAAAPPVVQTIKAEPCPAPAKKAVRHRRKAAAKKPAATPQSNAQKPAAQPAQKPQ